MNATGDFSCPTCGWTHLTDGGVCDYCAGPMMSTNVPVDNAPPIITRHAQSERFHAVLRELGTLHDRKQADYGRADAPFANVQGSVDWGVPAWIGAMVRANDKIRRLQKYAQDGVLVNEGVRDSFVDLAVYTIIGLLLWEDAS